jgi:DNA polymerase/3'-5' exonuclease PolX
MSVTAPAQRLPLVKAQDLAARVVDELQPACERIEIAGSIRQCRPDVGDIELVAIPRLGGDLFGDPDGAENLLWYEVERLIREGRLAPGERTGPKHRQLVLVRSGVKLDLYTADEDTWGVMLAIRTGPSSYSTSIVTPRSRGGLLGNGLKVHAGRLWPIREDGGAGPAIPTPTEADFLAFAGGWVGPEDRR